MIFLLFLISFSYANAASINKTETDLSTCITNLYTAVYSENYNCTSQYDFTSTNETVAQKSLFSGKSCVLEIVGETCTNSQFTEISSNFENFVKSLTAEPKDHNCEDSYYKHNAVKCMTLLNSLGEKSKLVLQMQPKVNDSRVLKLIDQCEGFKTCLNPTCFEEPPTMPCGTLYLVNSEFMVCITKLQNNPQTNKKFPCLEGMEFNSKDIVTQVKLHTTHKECTKEIMKESCGDDAIVDFDERAEQMIGMYSANANSQLGL
ncbi:unnamed protein product [Caenorhabditis nigoni]